MSLIAFPLFMSCKFLHGIDLVVMHAVILLFDCCLCPPPKNVNSVSGNLLSLLHYYLQCLDEYPANSKHSITVCQMNE